METLLLCKGLNHLDLVRDRHILMSAQKAGLQTWRFTDTASFQRATELNAVHFLDDFMMHLYSEYISICRLKKHT